MSRTKSITLASLLLITALAPLAGAGAVAAQSDADIDTSEGEEWSSPSLPVTTTVNVSAGEQVLINATGASDNLSVSVTDSSSTEVASGTISESNGSIWVDPGAGESLTVEVSSSATSPTVDSLSVSVGVPTADGETWSNPSLPVSSTVTTNDTEEVRFAASNASHNLTVTLSDTNGTEIANGTLSSGTDVVWLDPGTNGTYDVTVEAADSTATGVTVDELTVEVATNSPDGGSGGGTVSGASDWLESNWMAALAGLGALSAVTLAFWRD